MIDWLKKHLGNSFDHDDETNLHEEVRVEKARFHRTKRRADRVLAEFYHAQTVISGQGVTKK